MYALILITVNSIIFYNFIPSHFQFSFHHISIFYYSTFSVFIPSYFCLLLLHIFYFYSIIFPKKHKIKSTSLARDMPNINTQIYLFFICGTKSSTHDLIPFCKFYRLYMGFYSTSLHHSHLFRESKNEVWCKKWCKWCIAIFSFGFYSIAINPVFHFTIFSS